MRIFFIFLVLLLKLSPYSYSQKKEFTQINVEVFDDNNVGVLNYTLKIESVKTNKLLKYLNSGNHNTIETTIPYIPGDSIILTVSHTGFHDSAYFFSDSNKRINFSVKLIAKNIVLPEVLVNVPDTWKRGDTTFFRAEAYNDGSELKLKDLILQMPGFRILNDGKLTYQGVIVDRILVDGEDIMSDKINLLLNNFPTHVINTIQAIENQAEKKILKGLLSDNLLIVNIGLKKNVGTTFGSAEAGAGTVGRYNFNPVIFSFLNKIKAAYIGNWNSLATGIGWQKEQDFNTSKEYLVEPLLMHNQTLQIIPGFESKRFLRNEEWDNRLQINTPLSKKVKNKLEINYLRDNQKQQSFYQSRYFDNNLFFGRNDTNHLQSKPLLLNVKQSFIYDITENQEIRVTSAYYKNSSIGSQKSDYKTENGNSSYLDSEIKNDLSKYSVNVDYSRRKNVNKALELKSAFLYQYTNQKGEGFSNEWDAVYNPGNPLYDLVNHNVYSSNLQLRNELNFFTKNKGTLISKGIISNYSLLRLKGNAYLTQSVQQGLQHGINDINGKYETFEVSVYIKKSLKFLLPKSVILNVSTGLVESRISDSMYSNRILTPLINVSLNTGQTINKKISLFSSINILHKQVAQNQLQDQFFATSMTSYKSYRNTGSPLTAVYFNNNASISHTKGVGATSIGVNYVYNQRNEVYKNTYNSILNFLIDSFVNRPLSKIILYTNSNIPSIVFNGVIGIDALYSKNDFFLYANSRIIKGANKLFSLSLKYKRNWDKKIYLTFNLKGEINSLKIQEAIAMNLYPHVVNVNQSLKFLYKVNRNTKIEASYNQVINNIATINRRSLSFCDISFDTKLIYGKPLFVNIKADNLLNETYYYSINNSALYQSFYQVPLIRRNIFIGLRYEL